ncbi:MAG: Hpt domain-containing protein [Planctomycetota bacterium]|nr:Hpt domain-containing protein [Planctomycetota bacterium]
MNGKVDWIHARAAVGGSPDLLVEVVDLFFEEYPKLIVGIQSSIESEAFVELRRFAHTLKGCLRYFGPTQAGQLSFELEIMGRDGQLERATEVFGDLQTEMDSLVPELTAFAASQSPETDA